VEQVASTEQRVEVLSDELLVEIVNICGATSPKANQNLNLCRMMHQITISLWGIGGPRNGI